MKNQFPKAHPHKASGQARVHYKGRHYYLGKWGTSEARQNYDKLKARMESAQGYIPDSSDPEVTVKELVLSFVHFAESHYRRPDNSQTAEVSNFRMSLKPLLGLHGDTPVSSFGPLALKEVRAEMIKTLARKVVNQRIGRIKRVFRWGVENEIVAAHLFQALSAVRGLQRGRSGAREVDPILPVALEAVEATIPHCPPSVQGIIKIQLYSGMRPGEACEMNAVGLDMSGDLWTYKPEDHKTAWRDKSRTVWLGPKAQDVIREWIPKAVFGFLFPTSTWKPKQKHTSRAPGKHYTTMSYGKVIKRAAIAAKVEPWTPLQLRHLVATQVRKEFGLEGAQVILGHERADVTQVYAERDATLAEKIIRKIG